MLDIWENSLRKVKLHWEANFTTQTPAQVDQRLMISSKKCMGFFLDLFQNTVVDELWICPGWIVNAKVLAQHSKLYNTALHRVHTWNVTFQPYVWAFAWVHRAVQHWTDYLAVLYSIMCNCALYRFIREATRGEIVIKCGECRGGICWEVLEELVPPQAKHLRIYILPWPASWNLTILPCQVL